MNTPQFAKPVPGVSVAQLLRDIKKGEVASFDKKDASTSYLRSKASSLKYEFRDRIYSVNEFETKTEVSWKLKSKSENK